MNSAEKPNAEILKGDDMSQHVPEPVVEHRLLSPVERLSEILFGLIMALTFTCTIRIASAQDTDVRQIMIAAIGCNVAWGLVDAVMYLLMTLTEKGHNLTILNFVRESKESEKVHSFIVEALPPVIASVMKPEEIEGIRQRIYHLSNPPSSAWFTFRELKTAAGIFLLVFLSTFPIVIPFFFIEEVQTALRTSNVVAIILMFCCGWILGRYAGRNRIVMGIAMSLIGILLVLIAILLGG